MLELKKIKKDRMGQWITMFTLSIWTDRPEDQTAPIEAVIQAIIC